MKIKVRNNVTARPAAPADVAKSHYEAKFSFETDCWDVHATQDLDDRGFVLVDVRSEEAFARGHLPGAINLHHVGITEQRLLEFPPETLFVVYCAGPHCNGSTRGALQFAQLGRPVKEMIGGTLGWVDEGFRLTTS